MIRSAVLAGSLFALSPYCGPALANQYNADAASCDGSSPKTLAQLCPGGFGVPSYPNIGSQMANQPNNANMIIDAAKKAGIDPKLALAVAGAEGGMSSCAGSFSGVKGPMQLTQSTGNSYGQNRDINSQNITGGVAVLKAAIASCGSSTNIACLASRYNGSTQAEQTNWTTKVTQYKGQLDSMATSSIPSGCSDSSAPAQCELGPGGFTPGSPTAATATAPTDATITVPDSATAS